MIYLIDDKKQRQQNMGWTADKLTAFKDVLMPVYDNIGLQKHKLELFKPGNAVLFHESYFDVASNQVDKESIEIQRWMSEYAENKNFPFVRFSGSMGSRDIVGQQAFIPFEILYTNLQAFLEEFRNSGEISVTKLVLGTNDHTEEILRLKANIFNALYEKKDLEDFKLTADIRQNLEALKKIMPIDTKTSGITNGCLKRQLENI